MRIILTMMLIFLTSYATQIELKNIKQPTKVKNIKIEAIGVGVVNYEVCSKAQALAMARRAAVLEAYKALAEKIYGIKINGRDSVKNMILENSNIRANVEGLIRGANVEEEKFNNGMYIVRMGVSIDAQKKELIKNFILNPFIFFL